MAFSAFCTTCQRTVYVEKGDTPVCPVCSSPLLETVEVDEDETVKD
jgi:RNA polymerase subunit RPABC4/transcription elongation factor Spt4